MYLNIVSVPMYRTQSFINNGASTLVSNIDTDSNLSWNWWASTKLILKWYQNQMSPTSKHRKIIVECTAYLWCLRIISCKNVIPYTTRHLFLERLKYLISPNVFLWINAKYIWNLSVIETTYNLNYISICYYINVV